MIACVHNWRDYGEGASIVCSKCGAFKPVEPAHPMTANTRDEALRNLAWILEHAQPEPSYFGDGAERITLHFTTDFRDRVLAALAPVEAASAPVESPELVPCPDCKSRGHILFQCVACSHGNYPPAREGVPEGMGDREAGRPLAERMRFMARLGIPIKPECVGRWADELEAASNLAATIGSEGGWIAWNGGERPLDEWVRVHVRLRSGDEHRNSWARNWDWGHGESCDHIIAYCIAAAPTAGEGSKP